MIPIYFKVQLFYKSPIVVMKTLLFEELGRGREAVMVATFDLQQAAVKLAGAIPLYRKSGYIVTSLN